MVAPRKCPSCGKPAAPRSSNGAFPFCSDRCRLLDLGRWLSEEYRVPAGRPGDGAVAESVGNPEDES